MVDAQTAAKIAYDVFPGRAFTTTQSAMKKEGINDYNIIIYFPELIISNTRRQKHTIKDLYVKLEVQNGTRIHLFSGCRTKLSSKEMSVGYNHSHISSGGFGVWGGFCTGSSFVRELLGSELTEDNLYALLFNLEAFVSHESLEGRPYKYITQLSQQNDDSVNPYSTDHSSYIEGNNLSFDTHRFFTRTDKQIISEAMINAFCEFMASSSVIYKNEKGEEVISFERVWSLRDVRYEISQRLKNHTFPELNVFGYCCDPEKPGLLNNIHTCLWQSQFLTKGHLKVRSIESRDTEHETEINPKIIILNRINEDLTTTAVNVPAIRYTTKQKKKSTVEWDYQNLNIGSGPAELESLMNKLSSIQNDFQILRNRHFNNCEFLNTLIQ